MIRTVTLPGRSVATFALLAGIICCARANATAGSIALFDTGVDASENLLPGGSSDPHWSIIAGPGITSPIPAVVVTNQKIGTYAQSSDSAWVWVNASGVAGTNSPYTFQETFNLTGVDPATVSMSGSWGVDNFGSILLNGSTPVGSGALTLDGFTSFQSFTITGGFVSGINTLDFVTTDQGVIGGLNVNHLVITVSSVPEPGSLMLLGIGAAGVLTAVGRKRWRARKRQGEEGGAS